MTPYSFTVVATKGKTLQAFSIGENRLAVLFRVAYTSGSGTRAELSLTITAQDTRKSSTIKSPALRKVVEKLFGSLRLPALLYVIIRAGY